MERLARNPLFHGAKKNKRATKQARSKIGNALELGCTFSRRLATTARCLGVASIFFPTAQWDSH